MKNRHTVTAGLVVFLALPGCAQPARAVQTGQELADFDRRVKAYAALRDELEGGAARLEETSKPEEIKGAQTTLAARIRAARPAAARGEIFSPAIEKRFRSLLNSQMKGVGGQNTRGSIKDEGPGAGGFPFKVNSAYPETQPLGTVPPNVLAALPVLPEDIEYRFIDRHLILRDARANLIVDYIPNAIS